MPNFLQGLGQGLRVVGSTTSNENFRAFNRQNEFSKIRENSNNQLILGLLVKAIENGSPGAEEALQRFKQQNQGFANAPSPGKGIDRQKFDLQVGEMDLTKENEAKHKDFMQGLDPEMPIHDRMRRASENATSLGLTDRGKVYADLVGDYAPSSTGAGLSPEAKSLRDWKSAIASYGPTSTEASTLGQAYLNKIETEPQAKMRLLRELGVSDDIVKRVGAGVYDVEHDPVGGGVFVFDISKGERRLVSTVPPKGGPSREGLPPEVSAQQPGEPSAAFGLGAQVSNAWNTIVSWLGGGMPNQELNRVKTDIEVLNNFSTNALSGLTVDRETQTKWNAIAKLLPTPAGWFESPEGAKSKIEAFVRQLGFLKNEMQRQENHPLGLKPKQISDLRVAQERLQTIQGRYVDLLQKWPAGSKGTDTDDLRNSEQEYLNRLQDARTRSGPPVSPEFDSTDYNEPNRLR